MQISSRLNKTFVWLAAMILATHAVRSAAISSACASTPSEAVNAGSRQMDGQAGYRIAAVRADPLLHQRWATVVRCDHPELPSFIVFLPAQEQESALPVAAQTQLRVLPPAIKAGDSVRLWSRSSTLQIEVSGVAEESGAIGSRIRVRVAHAGLDGQMTGRTIAGVVRGPAMVEIL